MKKKTQSKSLAVSSRQKRNSRKQHPHEMHYFIFFCKIYGKCIAKCKKQKRWMVGTFSGKKLRMENYYRTIQLFVFSEPLSGRKFFDVLLLWKHDDDNDDDRHNDEKVYVHGMAIMYISKCDRCMCVCVPERNHRLTSEPASQRTSQPV